MTKEEQIKKELNNLNKIFKNIPEANKKIVGGLLQNCAFIKVTLEELQEDVNVNGATICSAGGNGYEIVKENPALKFYASLISKYKDIIAKLIEMLPKEEQNSSLSETMKELMQ